MEPKNAPERKRKHIYKPPIFGFHVSFRGRTLKYQQKKAIIALRKTNSKSHWK